MTKTGMAGDGVVLQPIAARPRRLAMRQPSLS